MSANPVIYLELWWQHAEDGALELTLIGFDETGQSQLLGARSFGVPLYSAELARWLVRSGVLAPVIERVIYR
jgi:hypothetical protein